MINGDIPQNEFCKGYKSGKDKSDFTITVIVLVLVMFIFPVIFYMFLMPFFMMNKSFSMDVPLPSGGVYYGGKIYYPTMQMDQAGGETILKAITPGTEDKVEIVGSISSHSPRLMEYNGRLLIFSSDGVGEYKDGKIDILFSQEIGEIFQPFIYNGKPAVIENLPDGLYLSILSDKKWDKIGKVYPELSANTNNEKSGREPGSTVSSRIQVLNLNDEYFYFYYSNSTLYLHKGIPFVENKESGEWIPVKNNVGDWRAIVFEDKPAILMDIKNSPNSRSSFNSNIIGLKYDGNSWKQFFTQEAGMIIGLGVYPTEEKTGFYILYTGFPGSSHLLTVKNGVVANDQKISKSIFSQFPFKWMFALQVLSILFYLIIIFFISVSMSKHRITEYRNDGVSINFASLWRRAVAKAIDSIFLTVPILFVYYKTFTDIIENFSPQSITIMFGNVMASFLWAFIVGLLFSYMEGKSGKTPGKTIMKIKVVGIDNNLQPVGFGRAIVRNFLLMVDSFFNYMVGILLIAFMDNWQRVGDLAAKTIVVEDNGNLEEGIEKRINTDNV